ncbi:uncharacterized protein DEA37_0011790 [Paragonimus westermani]|uniref:BRCT domain-containing protein n=1 Tax=Paragonimus westermani TaxID=34504 RepID=A0A5J4NE52_9TREM|nr:uncharacterized protein DEA37_0011790 [Paragonimus westermani]
MSTKDILTTRMRAAVDFLSTKERLLVHFDDGSKASLRPADILYINLLPIKAEVYADWSNSGEFWADCVIEAHLMDSRLPYLVHCRTNGERKALGRKDVSIHHSQVTLLRSMGQLPESTTAAFRKNNSSGEKRATRSADRPQSRSLLCSPDVSVSLANVLFSKRQAKVKRYRTSWVTPVTRLAAAEGQAGRREYASDTDHSRSSKPLSSPLCTFRDLSDRRTSVKQSKRTHGCATPPTQSKDSNVVSKKQRIDETVIQTSPLCLKPIEEHANLHDTPGRKSLDACVLPLPPDSSTSLFLRRSLSRTLGIPTPGPRVFSGWTLILTGHIQSSESVGSSDLAVDRSTLEQLVLACGGHIAKQISPRTFQTTNGSPVWGSEQRLSLSHTTTHIALVAPGCCRTLKYFQALATLGRVPMLHTDWILDACREEANSALDENVEPGTHIDWPLRLLMTRPGRYELPRGYNSSTKELVNWLDVPVRYRSPAFQSLPSPSLFSLKADWLDSKDSCELLAIVTNDMEVFGPAWSNILKVASGASVTDANNGEVGSCNTISDIPILSVVDAPKRLRQLFSLARSKHSVSNKAATDIFLVLVDVTELPVQTMLEFNALSVQLVTCDYFIQSLVRGHLVDPADSPSFVPPRH